VSKRSAVYLCVSRLKTFKTALFKLFILEHAQSLTLDRVREYVNTEGVSVGGASAGGVGGEEFEHEELMATIDRMQDDNQIMLSDNIIFLI